MSVECIDQLNGRFRGPIQAEREIAVGAPKVLRHCSRVSRQYRKRSVSGTMGGQVVLTEGTMNFPVDGCWGGVCGRLPRRTTTNETWFEQKP